MPTTLLERTPDTQLEAKTDAGGNGVQPPVEKLTAVAAEPPEGEKFNPQKAIERAATKEQFELIVSQHLGGVAADGAEIIEQDNNQN